MKLLGTPSTSSEPSMAILPLTPDVPLAPAELDAWVAYFQLLQDIAAEGGLDALNDEDTAILESKTTNSSKCGGEEDS